MSLRVMADVWASSLKGSTATHVMLALANEADDEGMNCFPGTKRLARHTRVSERTVIRTISDLERDGWLWVLQRGLGSGNRTEYRLNVQRLHEEAEQSREADRDRKRRHGVTFRQDQRKVTSAPRKGDTGAAKGDIGAGPLFVLPVTTQEQNPTPQPPLPRGSYRELELARAGDQVMNALALGRRKRRLIQEQLQLEADKGEVPATAALAMIAAWRRKAELSHVLRPCSLEKFFGTGIWRDERQWFWDKDAIRDEQRRSEARVGSVR
jgi:DNA-binding transcriptional regulator YhcF (GntR family)